MHNAVTERSAGEQSAGAIRFAIFLLFAMAERCCLRCQRTGVKFTGAICTTCANLGQRFARTSPTQSVTQFITSDEDRQEKWSKAAVSYEAEAAEKTRCRAPLSKYGVDFIYAADDEEADVAYVAAKVEAKKRRKEIPKEKEEPAAEANAIIESVREGESLNEKAAVEVLGRLAQVKCGDDSYAPKHQLKLLLGLQRLSKKARQRGSKFIEQFLHTKLALGFAPLQMEELYDEVVALDYLRSDDPDKLAAWLEDCMLKPSSDEREILLRAVPPVGPLPLV